MPGEGPNDAEAAIPMRNLVLPLCVVQNLSYGSGCGV